MPVLIDTICIEFILVVFSYIYVIEMNICKYNNLIIKNKGFTLSSLKDHIY